MIFEIFGSAQIEIFVDHCKNERGSLEKDE